MKRIKSNIFLQVLSGFFLLFLLESFLGVLGYPEDSLLEDPFIGFTDLYPLYELKEEGNGKKYYITREKKEKFFNKQQFSEIKGKNEFRIFCFGGSSTYGRPFYAKSAFPRFLEEGLSIVDPEKDYKVINAGGISYASYRVVSLMMETLQYKPDLFIVYSGHNEFLEERTYSHLKNISEFRKKTQFYLHKLNTYRVIKKYVLIAKDKMGLDVRGIKAEKEVLPSEVETMLDKEDGLDLYSYDFGKKQEIFEHFKYNIERMAELASSAGVPLIFLTLPSNIKDLSPFKSEPSNSLSRKKQNILKNILEESKYLFREGALEKALKEAEKGLEIDPNFSTLHYLKGEILLAKSLPGDAKKSFVLARDRDMVPLRATTRINNIIREVAGEKGPGFVDIDRIFEEKSVDGIPGDNLFMDHCHPTVEGHMIIAESLLDYMFKNRITGKYKPFNNDIIYARYREIGSSLNKNYLASGIANVGRVLNWAKKYDESVRRLEKGVEKYPNDPIIHHYLGVAKYKLGDKERALQEFTRALEINPKLVNSQKKIAKIFIDEGKNEKAVHLLKDIINKGTATPRVHFFLALAYTNMKEFDLAEKEYKEALKGDPESAEIYNNLGDIYKQKGDKNDAFEMYKKATELNPGLWNVYYNMGTYYFEMGLSEEAELQFRKVVKLKPDNLDSHYALAGIYDKRGNFDMAEEEYKKLLDIDPRSSSAHKDIGMFYSKNGMYKKSLEELESSLKLLEGEEINLRIEKVRKEDISFHFEDFTMLRAEIYNAMGNIYYTLRNFEKAMEMYLNVKKTNSNFPNIDYNAGITYFSMKKWEEAKDMLRVAKDKNEKNIDSTYYLAIAQGHLGNLDESVKLLKEAIRLNPDYASAYKDLGVLYLYKLKDIKSGIEYLEKSLQLSPDQPEAENIRKTLLNLKR